MYKQSIQQFLNFSLFKVFENLDVLKDLFLKKQEQHKKTNIQQNEIIRNSKK